MNCERCSHTLEILEIMSQSVFKDKCNHHEVELMKINSELGKNAHLLNNDRWAVEKALWAKAFVAKSKHLNPVPQKLH